MISEDVIESIKEIAELSIKATGSKEKSDDYILNSMSDHAKEIKQLFKENNAHWTVETGDLMIHCMTILTENEYDLNEIFEKCRIGFIDKISKKLGK